MNRTLSRNTLLAALLIVGLVACTATAADADRVALRSAIDRWMTAVNAQDAATLTSTMTADVELLDDASTAKGIEAAIARLRDAVAQGRLVASSLELTVVNDVAWHVVGITQVRNNGDLQAHGQALEIWKRVNGEWKLHRRMDAGVDAAAALTRPSTKEPVLDRR